jgi:anti-sigma factor RsiW
LKSFDLDKRLSAYLDGALPDGKRDRLERELERDPVLQKQLKRRQALTHLVREAWTEGPAAPPTEFLIAALRPQLAAISRERRERPAWQQALERSRVWLSSWLGPTPLATSAVAAFLLALAVLPRPIGPTPDLSAVLPSGQPALESTPVPRAPMARSQLLVPRMPLSPASLSQDSAAGVYDLSPGERPAMIFQDEDGSTVLWLLEGDDLSLLLERMDRWG